MTYIVILMISKPSLVLRGPLPSFLFANPCTAIALSYYDLTYMPHAIYHFKAYNIIYTNIITDDLLNV